MDLKIILDNEKTEYNNKATHIVQSFEWGEFRQKLGLKILRYGLYDDSKLSDVFTLSLHPVPIINKNIGYIPKGPFPTDELSKALSIIGEEQNCASIKLEPNFLSEGGKIDKHFKQAKKEVFSKYNFLLDLTQTEEQILANMHPKARYNIKVALKHKVWIEERTDDEGFQIFLKLYFDTAKRQNYHGHNKHYHTLLWQTLSKAGMTRVLIAFYLPEGEKTPVPLTSWMIYNFKDTLYYSYGGSATVYRNVMATNLLAYEAIKLGKKLNLKTFDLWGALPPNAPENHPWQGFNNFKSKLGAKLVSNMGTYDLIFDPLVFNIFSTVDQFTSLKILLLKVLGK